MTSEKHCLPPSVMDTTLYTPFLVTEPSAPQVIVAGGALLLALHPGLFIGHYFPTTKRL